MEAFQASYLWLSEIFVLKIVFRVQIPLKRELFVSVFGEIPSYS